MKLPLSWLNEYVNFDKSFEEISENLTMIGNEVESIDQIGDISGVIICEILKINKHPNADKLQITKLYDGSNYYSVVCGAPNIEVGQKIFLATIGSKLPDPENNTFFEIKKSKIRGEVSEGMICSEKELGLSDDHKGIMVLDNEYKLGDTLKKYFSDTILNIDVTPNRVDCLSIVGLARDISAKFSENIKFTYKNSLKSKNNNNVEILDTDICPRYSGVIIDSVKIEESPKWLKDKLKLIGERPINNIVDITNFVMFEIGQPLHAFDLSQIKEEKIFVRKSLKNEKIETLDGELRSLPQGTIVIADIDTPIGIAGIMGGKNSEIKPNTNSIFLEAANFNPKNIRSTSRKLGLFTEASMRFERNLKPDLTEYALSRAVDLIIDITGGKIRDGMEDIFLDKITSQEKIILNKEKMRLHLGLDIDNEKISKTLSYLDFKYEFDSKLETWSVEAPFWRSDVEIPEDLHEEIARIIGYDDIPVSFLSGEIPEWQPNKSFETKIFLQDILVSAGLNETISYSATSEKLLKITPSNVNFGETISLENPISNEHSLLRKSLIPSLLLNASRNTNNWKKPIKLFEVGNVFYTLKSKIIEKTMIAGILTGSKNELDWNQSDEDVNYFDAKGIVELILKKLNIDFEVLKCEDDLFKKNKSSTLFNKNINQSLGYLGEISDEIIKSFSFNTDIAVIFELDLEKLVKSQMPIIYKDFSSFPQAHRDISLIVDKDKKYEDIKKIIIAEKYVIECIIIDTYEGDEIPDNKRSLSIRINYQSHENTLSSKILDKIEKNILSKLNKQLGAYIRE
jgi:phenylalanyl-tRNA synthetase beta chain|tara:strand:+ start:1361 stop:3751 length:2391 start_codon:yes stop_codon:yes gene_type:complete